VIIAAITRPSGQLVISIDPHPRTGANVIMLAHVAEDETVTCRAPLQPTELPEVIAALQLAQQRLRPPRPQHRTISADDERGLF